MLPSHISSKFPAFLTKRLGIDCDLLQLVRACNYSGLGFAPFPSILNELHALKYDTDLRDFLSALLSFNKKNSGTLLAISAVGKFPSFEAYDGMKICDDYLRSTYIQSSAGGKNAPPILNSFQK